MTRLLEIKDKLVRFYSRYDTYLFMVVKFVLALIMMLIIRSNIGYMAIVSKLSVAFILAAVCTILPVNGMILIGALVVLLDMYALSIEAAIITLGLFAILYFVYFRFAPKDGIAVLLAPVCFKLNIPYVLPIGTGLLRPLSSVLSVICGTVLFYYLDGIHQVASTLLDNVSEEAEESSKIRVVLGILTSNKEMYFVIAIFVVTAVIVYVVRRRQIEHAWTVAIVAGALFEIAGLFAGYEILNISGKTVSLLIGGIVSMLIGFILQFIFMNLDYARTERVQFEDDDYYYYVKAVPKKMVAFKEKKVKHFGNTASMGKRIEHAKKQPGKTEPESSRQVIAREFDIDEDLLK